jgi:FimV-like protein
MIDKLVGKKVAKKIVKKATKKKETKGSKSKATQKGVKFGTNKTMVMAKDRPFGKDLDYQTGARGEAEVRGRPGGRAAVAETARAGKINIGDDAVGFDNFLRLQESRGILKREKAMRALEKVIENGTDKQKAKAKTMLKKMKSAALKSDIEATRRQTGGQRGKAKPDDFKDAQTMLEKTGEMGAAFERLTKNEQDRLIQSAKKKQMLKKQKEMPSDEARTKKKLAQRIMATDPRRGKAQGGMGLKMPTADQKGLKKLPTAVRNKMGYMYGGGMAKKPKMGSMDYRKGGLLLIAVDMMKKKKKGK